MRYTVLGATGFIGMRVAALARSLGHNVCCPSRDENLDGRDLGHVIYSIGITADFRRRPHDTVTAHVTKLQEVLTRTSFDSLVYLSSTRVYARCLDPADHSNPAIGSNSLPDSGSCSLPSAGRVREGGAVASQLHRRPPSPALPAEGREHEATSCGRSFQVSSSVDSWFGISEESVIPVLPTDFSDLYNLSKLMGESIALASSPRARVARLSNVVGPDFDSDNFIISVIRDCVRSGRVELQTALDSTKDYVSVDDVAAILLQLGPSGSHSIYNIASGVNTSHEAIVRELIGLTAAAVSVAEGSPTVTFPRIDIRRAATELNYSPRRLEGLLPELVSGIRDHLSRQQS